jgi:2-(1,2-epoxy-1,2-dihydrophenyl)acetyl-CoA isomerase
VTAVPEPESVLTEVRDGVMIVLLNRPEKINAVNAGMLIRLKETLTTAEADPTVGAIVLAGSGRGFCSGQDLSDRYTPAESPPPDLGASLDGGYNPLIRLMATMTTPIVAAVHGVAAGAGANLALACDVVIVGETSRFVEAFARVGLMPDCGGTWFLARSAGRARALGMALLAGPIDGGAAAAWGLAWQAVPDHEVLDAAMAAARRLAVLMEEASA